MENNPGKLIGIDIKPEYPKNPDIVISNNFKITTKKMSDFLLKKINNIINEKR